MRDVGSAPGEPIHLDELSPTRGLNPSALTPNVSNARLWGVIVPDVENEPDQLFGISVKLTRPLDPRGRYFSPGVEFGR
jgi:hypothetical protein